MTDNSFPAGRVGFITKSDAVSFKFFGDLAREYGMDKEFIGRFSKS